MQMLNYTYSYKLIKELATGDAIHDADLLSNQWGSRAITKNKKTLIFDDDSVPQLESI